MNVAKKHSLKRYLKEIQTYNRHREGEAHFSAALK